VARIQRLHEVPGRWLDLADVRAHVGEQQAAQRDGDCLHELDDSHVAQRPLAFGDFGSVLPPTLPHPSWRPPDRAARSLQHLLCDNSAMRNGEVWWEIEHNHIRLDDNYASWDIKNTSDTATAEVGDSLGTVTIVQRPDGTPYTNEITLDREVEPGTGHHLTYPLTWDGQEEGSYSVKVIHHDAPEVWAELRYRVKDGQVGQDYG
jgi:hypothetical protein